MSDPATKPAIAPEDDYLAQVRNALPPGERAVLTGVEKLRQAHVPTKRDEFQQKIFRRFLLETVAQVDGQREGSVFFVTGESGSGKSRSVEMMLEAEPALKPVQREFGRICPVVSISLDGPSTLTVLGKKILEQAGYPLAQRVERDELWLRLPRDLRHRGVLIVHIDETQHLVRETKTGYERQALANALKGLLAKGPWPISLILSGLPQTTELARLDEQVARRAHFMHLPDIQLPDNRRLVLKLIGDLCAKVDVDAAEATESDLPERIVHAANYRFGRCTQVIRAGLFESLEEGASRLERGHLSEAFLKRSHARGRRDRDVFLVRDWESTPAGSFILDPKVDL